MDSTTVRKITLMCLWAALSIAITVSANAKTWNVGPTHTYKTPCSLERAGVLANGDTIIIAYSPSNGPGIGYYDDTCNWTQNNLTIVGVLGPGGARPVLNTAGLTDTPTTGHISEHNGIWVISGNNTVIKNLEFENAMVSNAQGANGAGIRMHGKNLTVLNCYFHDNEDGILEGNVAGSHIVIKYSEFARNGVSNKALSEGYGYTHNVYIGHCASLLFAFNYSHDANVGHLLKTRAAVSYILYNRLTGENGTDSYEIDIPSGGTSYVIGNLIQQGENTLNPVILSYMEEGPNPRNPGRNLYVVNNTFVNQYNEGGTFVHVDPRARVALLQNNIFDGKGTITNQTNAVLKTNYSGSHPMLANIDNYNYHLLQRSPAINAGSQPAPANGFSLLPKGQYVHPACGQVRHLVGVIDVGAYEFGGGGPKLLCR